ncbi:MAG TPA: CDP-alcohol phosphatidyltransferase family protein [Bryobacteraceae bacterium]|nr:CDP-alcohol phosphatidyltransferase family protein [Bryobacteraceae bacterium]
MKHIPNLLSLARLALAPYVFVLLVRREYRTVLVLFAIAGLTDFLDGLAARKFGSTSRLGAGLDPVADKVLLSGTFLTLALTGAIEAWVAAVVLGRDVLILATAVVLYLAKSRRSFPPSIWGKISTLVQIAFVLVIVGQVGGAIFIALKWATVVLAVVSGADYARTASRT